LFGAVTFSNRFTNHPYADFLLGIPTTGARAFPQTFIDRRRLGFDFFVTDDYKVSSHLTLNLGMRYEIHPSWGEVNGLQSIFDIASGKIVIPDGASGKISPLMPRGYVDVVEAGKVGLPGDTLLKTDRNNVARALDSPIVPGATRPCSAPGWEFSSIRCLAPSRPGPPRLR